jgi:AcrR family transcriptional regulator
VDRTYVEGSLRRVPTQARARDKLDRALAAAERLLETEGVAAITLTRVADEADVSVGALYQYLPDRESILAALSADYHARHEQLMDALVDRLTVTLSPDPVGSVLLAIARLYGEQAGTRALRAGLQSAAQLRLTRDHKVRMVGKVQRLLAAYGLTGPDDDRVARTVFFAADALMHEAFGADETGDAALLGELESLVRAYLSSAQNA